MSAGIVQKVKLGYLQSSWYTISCHSDQGISGGFLCVIVLEAHTCTQSLYATKLVMKYSMSIKYGRVHYLHLLI